MSRIFASKDFLAGGLYMAFGLLGLWLGRNLDAGTASAMEAGYFPRLVCALLVAIGAALAAMSLFRAGEVPERGRWRPLVFVTLSCLARNDAEYSAFFLHFGHDRGSSKSPDSWFVPMFASVTAGSRDRLTLPRSLR